MEVSFDFTQDILDSLSESIYTVNKDFRINSLNQAAEKLTGYRREEVIGKLCKNILNTERCIKDCPIARVLETGKNLHDIENTLVTKNGKEIPIIVNGAVFKNSQSQPIGGVVSFRDRKEDIPHLVRHFIDKFSLKSNKNITDIDDEVMECLISYPWPGNIRELENVIEYAFARSTSNLIHLSKIPP